MNNESLRKVFYKSNLDFAKELTPEQRKGKTPEQWATDETEAKINSLQKRCKDEANETLVDYRTGKKLGKRKDVERRFS